MRTLKVIIVTSSLLAVIAVSTVIIVFFMTDKNKQGPTAGRESAWKNFEHSKYRIQYPADYTIETEGNAVSFYAPWEIETRAMPNYTDQPLGYHISARSINPKYSLEQWLQEKHKDCIAGNYCTMTKTTVGVARTPGYLVHEEGLADGYYSLYLKNADTILVLTGYWEHEIMNQDSTFNTMLASFELVE